VYERLRRRYRSVVMITQEREEREGERSQF